MHDRNDPSEAVRTAPWTLTPEKYVAQGGHPRSEVHARRVMTAILCGKDIPEEVRASYPQYSALSKVADVVYTCDFGDYWVDENGYPCFSHPIYGSIDDYPPAEEVEWSQELWSHFDSGEKLPKDSPKREAAIRALIVELENALARDYERYEYVRATGDLGESDYSLMMSYGSLGSLNLTRNHIYYDRSKLMWARSLLSPQRTGQFTLDLAV